MRSRYFLNLTLACLAIFMIVASQAFALIDIDNLSLGVGIGMLLVSLALALRHRAQLASLLLGATSALISAWMIFASQVFSLGTTQNMTFACSLAVAGLAAIGLTVHELSTERVVHSLQPLPQRESEVPYHEPLVS